MNRSLRRDGQYLVAVGAVLGAAVGIVLGLAVEGPQAGTAIAAPRPARAAALAATPQDGHPTAAQPSDSVDQADGDGSTGRQRTRSVYRADQTQGRAGKDSKKKQKDDEEQHKRGKDKPSKDDK